MAGETLLREQHDGAFAGRTALRLWLRLLRCTTVIEKRLQRRLGAEFGSTLPRFDALAALERNPRGMTMGALSRALLVSNGNVTGLVQGLVREGFVTLEVLPSDRRSSLARLSASGREHFEQMAAAHHRWVEETQAELGPGQRDALYALLGDLRRSIDCAAPEEAT
jgi:DNA-binding MarR family transcriptional regulator